MKYAWTFHFNYNFLKSRNTNQNVYFIISKLKLLLSLTVSYTNLNDQKYFEIDVSMMAILTLYILKSWALFEMLNFTGVL